MVNVPDEIKDLLHKDNCMKNIRIHFPNLERSDICNDQIVFNSVRFTESLCSQNTLKFGLCEASVFECEVVRVSNIKDVIIEVYCEIFCDASVSGAEWRADLEHYVYSIPYGFFTVNSCKRQADILHRKIVAYGGTANLPSENEILTAKERCHWFRNVSYTPDIFATVMMLFGSNSLLGSASYTEITADDGLIDTRIMYLLFGTGFEDDYYLSCDCIAYQITENNDNFLYYFDTENAQPYKSIEEIENELLSSGYSPYEYMMQYIKSKFLFGTGQSSILRSVGGLITDNVATQRGMYIYPYQTADYTNLGAPSYIFIPYKINIILSRLHQTSVIASSEFRDKTNIKLYKVNYEDYPHMTFTVQRDKVDDGVYRLDSAKLEYMKWFSSLLELSGVFMTFDRYNQFKMIDIKRQFLLLPENDLYPASDLHPESQRGGQLLPDDYQQCWYDDDYYKPYGAVECRFRNTSNQDWIYTLYLTGFNENTPVNTYKVYYLNNNMLISQSTWTEEQIHTICNFIANRISGVTYMPVEFTGRGLPYVEAGDTFEILTGNNDSITTIVLKRTLTGEMVLTDSYKSV